jgi:hypothetical protein
MNMRELKNELRKIKAPRGSLQGCKAVLLSRLRKLLKDKQEDSEDDDLDPMDDVNAHGFRERLEVLQDICESSVWA